MPTKYTIMKKLLFGLIGAFLFASITSQAQEKPKSPAKSAEGKIGNTEIVITYSSPSMRGRTIYGELVPFNKVWRAGANEATTISFSNDVKVNGENLKAGKYAFFLIPNEKGNWEAIFNTESKQWGAYKLDKSKNALMVAGDTKTIDEQEGMTYSIGDGAIHLDWEKTRFSLNIEE